MKILFILDNTLRETLVFLNFLNALKSSERITECKIFINNCSREFNPFLEDLTLSNRTNPSLLQILKQKKIVHSFDVLINLSSSISGFSKFLCLKLNSSIINYSSFSLNRMWNKNKPNNLYITKQLVKLQKEILNSHENVEEEYRIVYDKNAYRKNYDFVNWRLKSSGLPTITNHNFCFVFISGKSLSNKLEFQNLKFIFSKLNDYNLKSYLFTNSSVSENVNLEIQKLSCIDMSNINLIDITYLLLFIKHSRCCITNNLSIKIMGDMEQKKVLFYNLENKKFSQTNFLLDLKKII